MAAKTELIIQKEELIYPETLFNLPINPIQRPHLTLWSGRAGRLKHISEIAATITSFGWPYRLMAGSGWSNILPPGTEKLEYEITQSGQIRDYLLLLETIKTDNLILFGPDLEMSSNEQILAEKLLQELINTRLITAEVLRIFKTNPKLYQKTDLTIFASTADLLSLAGKLRIGVRLMPDGGIYNKIELLQGLSLGVKRFIVFDNSQIIVFDSTLPDKIGVFNSSINLAHRQATFIGLCAAILAVPANNKRFTESVMTACYLINQLLVTDSKPAPTLKQLLVKYFD